MPHPAGRIKQLRAIFARYKDQANRQGHVLFSGWEQHEIPKAGKGKYAEAYVRRKGYADYTRFLRNQGNHSTYLEQLPFNQYLVRLKRAIGNSHVQRINNKLERGITSQKVRRNLSRKKLRVFRDISDFEL